MCSEFTNSDVFDLHVTIVRHQKIRMHLHTDNAINRPGLDAYRFQNYVTLKADL